MSVSAANRPRIVEAAFWTLLVGAVLLVAAGLLVATVNADLVRDALPDSFSDEEERTYLLFFRALGALYALAGAGLAFLTGQLRKGDVRWRRATLWLAVTTIVVVTALTVIGGTGVLPLVALVPVLVGAMLLGRAKAKAWFQREAGGEP